VTLVKSAAIVKVTLTAPCFARLGLGLEGTGSGSGDDDRRHENVARKPLVLNPLKSLVNRISICCPPAMTAEGVVLPLRPWHAASGSGSGSCDDDRRHELDVLSPLSDNRR